MLLILVARHTKLADRPHRRLARATRIRRKKAEKLSIVCRQAESEYLLQTPRQKKIQKILIDAISLGIEKSKVQAGRYRFKDARQQWPISQLQRVTASATSPAQPPIRGLQAGFGNALSRHHICVSLAVADSCVRSKY